MDLSEAHAPIGVTEGIARFARDEDALVYAHELFEGLPEAAARIFRVLREDLARQ